MSQDCRIYLISPPLIEDLDEFAKTLNDALSINNEADGDVACFQLRLKKPNGDAVEDQKILHTADKLLPIFSRHDVSFLINDRPDIAKQVGADGVHIGQNDASYKDARNLLGEEASIGVTCHDSRHLALLAGEAGADYVAFGAFFPTRTKITETVADVALLTWWQEATTVPCVAIGGITAENSPALVRAGADFLAVSNAVWNHKDGPAQGIRSLNAAIAKA